MGSLFTNLTRLDLSNCTDCTDEVTHIPISLFSRTSFNLHVQFCTAPFSRTLLVWICTNHTDEVSCLRISLFSRTSFNLHFKFCIAPFSRTLFVCICRIVPTTLMRCLVYVSLSFHELYPYISIHMSLSFHELYSSASVALYLSHWWGDSSTYLSLLTNCIFIYPFICHSLSTNLTRLDFRIVPTALMRWLVYAFLSFHELYLFSTCISRSLFTNWTRLDCLNCTDCTDEVARLRISLFSRTLSPYPIHKSLPFHELDPSWLFELYRLHWWGGSSMYLSLFTSFIILCLYIHISIFTNMTRLDTSQCADCIDEVTHTSITFFSRTVSSCVYIWQCADSTDEVTHTRISLSSQTLSVYVYAYISLFSRTCPV